MKLTIKAAPVTKKNHQQIVMVKGRPRIIQGKKYRDYETTAVRQIAGQLEAGFEPMDGCYNVQCLFYTETHRRVDLTNLLEAVDDVLVRAGVLADDNSLIIGSHDGSRVLYDKVNPRTEILITEFIL